MADKLTAEERCGRIFNILGLPSDFHLNNGIAACVYDLVADQIRQAEAQAYERGVRETRDKILNWIKSSGAM